MSKESREKSRGLVEEETGTDHDYHYDTQLPKPPREQQVTQEWYESLPHHQKLIVSICENALKIIKKQEHGWEIWADQVINRLIPQLVEILKGLNKEKTEEIRERIQELINNIDESIPDSFQPTTVKEKK